MKLYNNCLGSTSGCVQYAFMRTCIARTDPWTQWAINHCRKCRKVMGGFPTFASCFRCVLGSARN